MQNISGQRKDRELIETNIKVKEKSGNWRENTSSQGIHKHAGLRLKIKDFFPLFLFVPSQESVTKHFGGMWVACVSQI